MTVERYITTVGPRPESATRLIVFPHAGGSATGYRSWAGMLGPDIELSLVEYPGHGARMEEPLVADHAILVEQAATVIARSDARTALLGHSMGALIAFETARTLSSWGAAPIHLFVSAAQAPSTFAGSGRTRWTDGELLAELVRYGGTPSEFIQDPAIRRMLIGTLRSDYRLLDRYSCDADEPLSQGITAFYGIDDEDVSQEDILRWRAMTKAGFDVWSLSGGHFYDAASIHELCARVEKVVGALSADTGAGAATAIHATRVTTT